MSRWRHQHRLAQTCANAWKSKGQNCEHVDILTDQCSEPFLYQTVIIFNDFIGNVYYSDTHTWEFIIQTKKVCFCFLFFSEASSLFWSSFLLEEKEIFQNPRPECHHCKWFSFPNSHSKWSLLQNLEYYKKIEEKIWPFTPLKTMSDRQFGILIFRMSTFQNKIHSEQWSVEILNKVILLIHIILTPNLTEQRWHKHNKQVEMCVYKMPLQFIS